MMEQQVKVEAVLLEKLTYQSPASELQDIVAFFRGVVRACAPAVKSAPLVPGARFRA